MNELDDRLRSDAHAWQDTIGSSPLPVVLATTARPASAASRWLGPVLAVAAVLIIAIAGADWTSVDREHARVAAGDSSAPIQVALTLDRTSAHPGETIAGTVTITNTTDSPISAGCALLVAVGLTNDTMDFEPIWAGVACSPDDEVTIKPGTTTVRLDVQTRYQSCDQAPPSRPVGNSACTPDPRAGSALPPLPAGDYDTQIVVLLRADLVAQPTPIRVTLTD